ncbi:MAG: hypothetical protein HYY24_09415 [Verrucomicrobia bacterium]|nr:hypothetical protein [Verrucomicrobiota bacterium]
MKLHTHAPQLLGSALLTTALLAHGQALLDLPFTSGSTGVDGPLILNAPPTAGRYTHAMAYDTARQQVVMFGGYRSPNYLGDTWVLDGANWKQLTASGPGARQDAAMAYDAARGQVVLFGGYNGSRFGDTWVWNGSSWAQLDPTTAPSARYGHKMVYDSVRQQIVLFGGNASGNNNETWTWNGTTWSQRNPADSPSPRTDFDMAYDVDRQQLVLFGGSAISRSSETWVWTGSNWTKKTPAHSPPVLDGHALAYDATLQQIVLFGGATDGNDYTGETWVWDGADWTKKTPATKPTPRHNHALVYDAAFQQIVLYGGNSSGAAKNDTWIWDGNNGNWLPSSDDTVFIDMTAKPTGVWNFTSITVPAGVTVRFRKTSANAPVQWLASEHVVIDGTVDLSGAPGVSGGVEPGNEAPGGPGGFAGGLGGPIGTGAFAGSPGQGPGGGAPGRASGENGKDGRFGGLYGNVYLQPLIGGSGGGGGAATATSPGGNGGGGGGAILISSSRDILVNGTIQALGGGRSQNGSSYGGNGSGGAIRLVADRLSGKGALRADGGRIRLEAFFRSLTGQITPAPAQSAPVATRAAAVNASLQITKIAGQNVAQPPTGQLVNPDVVFTEAGPITVTVSAQGVPDGTAVRIRVTTPGEVINAPPDGDPVVVLSGGKADITVTVPKGSGTIQAFAEFTAGQ